MATTIGTRGTLFLVLLVLGFSSNYAFEFVHHDQDALLNLLSATHDKCPDITRLYDLSPNSIQGRIMRVIVFGKTPDQHTPGIPEFK